MIAIVGEPRSGSTLLMGLLDGSPDLWVYPGELNYLWYVYNPIQGIQPDPKARDVDSVVLQQWIEKHYAHIQEAYANKLVEPYTASPFPLDFLASSRKIQIPESLEIFLDTCKMTFDRRPNPQKRINVFKTTETDAVARYRAMFPEMRFLHIIRNPITNFSSVKRTNANHKNFLRTYRREDDMSLFMHRWTAHAADILCYATPGATRDYYIRYEDLCDAPEATINGICHWLDISPPVEPTRQTTLGGQTMKKLPIPPSKKSLDTPATVVSNMARTFAYDTVLSRNEEAFLAYVAAPFAKALRYDVSAAPTTLGAKALLALSLLMPDKAEFRYLRPGRSIFYLAANMAKRRRYILSNLLGDASATAAPRQAS